MTFSWKKPAIDQGLERPRTARETSTSGGLPNGRRLLPDSRWDHRIQWDEWGFHRLFHGIQWGLMGASWDFFGKEFIPFGT